MRVGAKPLARATRASDRSPTPIGVSILRFRFPADTLRAASSAVPPHAARERLTAVCLSLLLATATAFAQGGDQPACPILSIGNYPNVNGLRLNFRDSDLGRVNGMNVTVWTPYEPMSGTVDGVALGLPVTGANDINGLALGALGLVGVLADEALFSSAFTVRRQLRLLEERYGSLSIEAAAARTGIAHALDRHPVALSGGALRRAELAAVLVRRPRCVVADHVTWCESGTTQELGDPTHAQRHERFRQEYLGPRGR